MEATDLFTLKGLKSKDKITVDENGVVTLKASNLVDNPTAGTKVELTGDGYTLALADDVPQAEAAGIKAMSGTSGYTISADGVYKFAEGFTGTVTIGANAKNVKIIGASSTLSNVSIDASAVSGINLWIQNLVISSTEEKNLIKFGSGDNYLTVKGTNTLTDSAMGVSYDQALINVGSGTLNIIGDGTLTAEMTGSESYGAAIGTDYRGTGGAINIGGSVNITAKNGWHGAGIGAGDNGSVNSVAYGTGATVTNNGTVISDDQKNGRRDDAHSDGSN